MVVGAGVLFVAMCMDANDVRISRWGSLLVVLCSAVSSPSSPLLPSPIRLFLLAPSSLSLQIVVKIVSRSEVTYKLDERLGGGGFGVVHVGRKDGKDQLDPPEVASHLISYACYSVWFQ